MTVQNASGRLRSVCDRIARACAAAGRNPGDVLLIGVSKTHPPQAISELVHAGLTHFGENRVQELRAKHDELPDVVWHLIGQLQTNKAATAVQTATLIHSLDRASLAKKLSDEATKQQRSCRALLQVNVDDDPQKAGCQVSEAHDLLAYATSLPHLHIEGLMTIPAAPPAGVDPNTAARPAFATLRELRDALAKDFPQLTQLSMGMSQDVEAAVSEGATMVRVGTALFGSRGAGPWQKDQL